ncbi:MAG: hypothetical protein E4H36_00885 [Spirochaetales bacterium]|nr:MAG: hypothetical protein E4H36_00885 [Spirochaetales bacterium]
MRKRLLFLISAVFFVTGTMGFAQSNEVVDTLLSQEKALYSETVYLALSAAGMIDESATPDSALEFLFSQPWKIKAATAETPIRLGELSYVLMKALGLPGGIMFGIVPGPRYAARDLLFYGIIDKFGSPYRYLSGAEALRIIRNAVEWKEAQS